jgi:uncharacterized membrane protein
MTRRVKHRPSACFPIPRDIQARRERPRISSAAAIILICATVAGCKPDDSPLKGENDTLRRQITRQESVLNSLQDGNKVMQQQIDLLNQELRDAKKEAERAQRETEQARNETKDVGAKLAAQITQTKKLTDEIQRTAAVQAASTVRSEDKGGQSEEFPRPLALIAKATEESLARNGYALRVSVKLEQKAVYVTERKISAPASLEASGFRNQFLVSIQSLPTNITRLTVKAEFEKLAQGNRILIASSDEAAEIERRLIAEINKTVSSQTKL